MILMFCNILCMMLTNICFFGIENMVAGYIFLVLQLVFFILQIVTKGEV